ncbi:putative amidoligase enzyme [Venturia nashicola]|nr:putative amidoligase enzyme [Venturia nashicola]
MASPVSYNSTASSTSSSASSAATLTFGIELEGIFAFHQDRLQAHLTSKLPHANIVKDLNDDQRTSLRQAKYPRQVYQSWALANAGKNSMTAETSVEHDEGRIRAYKDEPLHVAKELLKTMEQGKGIFLWNPEDHAKPEVYDKRWILTADQSLESLKEEEKILAFPAKIKNEEKDHWDSYGIELVSPPYSEHDLSTAEADISSLLSALETPTSGITTNETCGVHVHIGLPSGECLPIKVLQHLCKLLVIYEDEISRLHPLHRRGRSDEIESNKIRFAAEGLDNEALDFVDRLVPDFDTGDMVMRKHESTYKAVHEIHRLLFDEVDESPDPIAQLQKLVGKARGMIVNFAYLNRTNGPQTIEFRQHAGSIDPKEIGYWVNFCLGLVNLARRFADEVGECQVKHWKDRVDIGNLMEEMGLEQEVEEFYGRKIAVHGDEGVLGEEGLWQEVLEEDDLESLDV